MRLAIVFVITALSTFYSHGQNNQSGPTGCEFNSLLPEKMAPGEVSQSDRYEFGVTLNHDCSELFVGIEHGQWVSIEQYKRTNKGWKHIRRLLGSEEASTNDPMLSLDNKRLYFILKTDGKKGRSDIAFIERTGSSTWSEHRILPAPVNTPSNEYYTSFNTDGDLVFASNRDSKHPGDYNLYRARYEGGQYTEVIAYPEGINRYGYEADPFIAPDNDYLLFASNRPGGKGKGDIYISFNLGNDKWSPPKNIEAVNTKGHELCPYVSADGSTLFYTSNEDIYRVSATIIESLRPTLLNNNNADKSQQAIDAEN